MGLSCLIFLWRFLWIMTVSYMNSLSVGLSVRLQKAYMYKMRNVCMVEILFFLSEIYLINLHLFCIHFGRYKKKLNLVKSFMIFFFFFLFSTLNIFHISYEINSFAIYRCRHPCFLSSKIGINLVEHCFY